MQKFLLSIFIAIAVINISFAQENYLRVGIGYALVQAGQTIDGTATPYNGSVNNSSLLSGDTMSYSIKKASFAAGLHAFIGGGHMFTNNFGFDFALDIGIAPKKYTFTDNNANINSGSTPIVGSIQYVQHASTPILFTPAIVMQTGGKVFNFYTRVGLAIPIRTRVIQDQIYQNAPGTGAITTDDFTLEIQNSFSLGLTGAFGMQYKLNEKYMLWGEINGLSMALFTKQGTITKITENGQNVISYYPDSLKVYTYSNNAQVSPNNPTTQPAYSQPFSNIGFAAGIKCILGRKRGSAHRKMGKNYDDNDNF